MFPIQLMAVRRSNKGILRPVFLGEENSDYCSSVITLFSRSIGKTRGEIEDELKNLELKVQNPKILKGLALVMFRLSKFVRASQLDSERVRKTVFSIARNPAVSPEERRSVIERAAMLLVTEPQEIEGALYGDMERNLILASPASLTADKLSKMFNMEQIETVMMKALWVEVSTEGRKNELVRSLRSKGLMYSERSEGSKHKLKVDGPVSIFEKSERYGVRLALFIRDVVRRDDWEITALVSLKDGKRKREFIYHIDDSISDIIDRDEGREEKPPDFVNPYPKEIEVDGSVVTPDFSIDLDGEVYIFISTQKQYESDASLVRKAVSSGYRAETFCLIADGEKCPRGAICFKDRIDWWRIREYLGEKYRTRGESGSTSAIGDRNLNLSDSKLNSRVVSHLNALYPDGQAMVEYLEFMGLPLEATLNLAGFTTAWKGLRLVVTGKMKDQR
ncbi:MAG: DUF790 family protein [Thermoplasmata archaeon]